MDRPQLLTVKEAAEFLRVSEATLNRWRSERAGQGPRWHKFGGAVRYSLADLIEFCGACSRSPERGGRR